MQACNKPNIFSIFTGDAKIMNLKAVYQNTGDPLDLTSCTAIAIALPNADGSFATLSITNDTVEITSPPNLGKFAATISSAISALLNIGELQNVDVTFTIGGDPFTVRYYGVLSVFQTQ